MNDIERQIHKRHIKAISKLAQSTKEGGYVLAEACYALAYKAKEIASQMECNERNNMKLRAVDVNERCKRY